MKPKVIFILSWGMVITFTFVIGTISQFLLWKDETKSFVGIILICPWLWLIYLIIGVVIGEQISRLLRHR